MCIPLWNGDKAIAKCLCAAGYQLNAKNKCVKQLSPKFLLVAQNKPSLIKGIDIFNRSGDVLSITGLKEPRHLDYDVATNSVVYFDAGSKTIERVSLSNTNETRVLLERVYSTGVAVDWIGRNVFFIDGAQRAVKVLNLRNTTQVKTIITNLHELPTSIVLVPENGVLFLALWSDVSPMRGEIYTAFMNGLYFKPFVNESVHWPIGLSIDYETSRLFWCDQHKQTIESVDFKGNNRIVVEIEAQPSALVLISSSEFYVVSRSEGVIKHFVKNNTLTNTINRTSSDIFDIKLFNSNPSRKNLTSSDNPCSKCDKMCLLGPNNTATCTCSDGYKYQQSECDLIIAAQIPCPPNHFKCKSDWICKPNHLACDGKRDCSDGSDESTAPGGRCEHFECPKGGFRCDSTRCVPRNWVCDSQKDCEDGADEQAEKCMQTVCGEGEFQCNVTKKCISAVWRCDLSHDCGPGDFSDEMDCGKFSTNFVQMFSFTKKAKFQNV